MDYQDCYQDQQMMEFFQDQNEQMMESFQDQNEQTMEFFQDQNEQMMGFHQHQTQQMMNAFKPQRQRQTPLRRPQQTNYARQPQINYQQQQMRSNKQMRDKHMAARRDQERRVAEKRERERERRTAAQREEERRIAAQREQERRIAAQREQERRARMSGILHFVVLEATDVPKADFFGKSDPYVVVRCGGVQDQTTFLKKTYNPKWNQSLRLEVFDEKEPVQIAVYDHDNHSHDDLLCTQTIYFDQFGVNKSVEFDLKMKTEEQYQKQNKQTRLIFTVKYEQIRKQKTAAAPAPQPTNGPAEAMLTCICGEAMKKLNEQNCYKGNGVWCDKCRKKIQKGAMVYHCKRLAGAKYHPDGYDICTNCAGK
eukprot:CAMPEP_0202701966 /NCGR_PEP_ID=MMETSP1385-20130828/15013_1 /ASSEMBLY_ACC=CAM_ASM_000861 /TAXON_ID=933848 /ORGANISM="Elphidium margaritaceum" /LENGTH=366 /DNA_ID=CAMNT_0049359505 /DNA_START=91 /DNA_END=1191 /DNA_ORIENTATION=-